jgi:high-affinity nickel permease
MHNPDMSNILFREALKGIQLKLESGDRLARISQVQLLLLTPLDSYDAVKAKLKILQSWVTELYGPFFVMNCGFAEVVDSDIINAIDAASQTLRQAHQNNVITGIYYPKLQELK